MQRLPTHLRRVRGRTAPLALAACLILAAANASARTETLRWHQSDMSYVAGFAVHVGQKAGTYESRIDVAMATDEGNSVFRYDLEVPGEVTAFVAVTAYSATGKASPFSNEQIHAPDVASPECNSDSECTDGNACTGREQCVSGSCVSGTPPSCRISSQCAVGICDTQLGCVVINSANGTACDDGSLGTTGDMCIHGACIGSSPPAPGCTSHSECTDGNACTGWEQCVSGSCVSGTPPSCRISSQCAVGSCDAQLGCVASDLPNGTGCDDGSADTTGDICVRGVCTGSTPPPPDCSNDGDCNDGDACNGIEVCHSGYCRDRQPPTCTVASICQIGFCDRAGGCTVEDVPDGTPCGDSDPHHCLAGSCVGDTLSPDREPALAYWLNAGGPVHRDRLGTTWEPDDPYTGSGIPSEPVTPVTGSAEDVLYATLRCADGSAPLEHRLPLVDGPYRVRLHLFANAATTESQLVDIDLDRQTALYDFDLTTASGSTGDATVDLFTDVRGGELAIDVFGTPYVPCLAALEVTPGVDPGPAVAYYLINAGGRDFVDPDGFVWESDRPYVSRSYRFWRRRRIAGTDLHNLYRTVRTGRRHQPLSFEFPAGAGDYVIRLHFAEIGWRQQPGARLFDIVLEDRVVHPSYDIFSAAGGRFTAVVEEFAASVSDGSLSIEFRAIKRLPIISAIEILATSDTPLPE